jgi:hypothetical protein
VKLLDKKNDKKKAGLTIEEEDDSQDEWRMFSSDCKWRLDARVFWMSHHNTLLRSFGQCVCRLMCPGRLFASL